MKILFLGEVAASYQRVAPVEVNGVKVTVGAAFSAI